MTVQRFRFRQFELDRTAHELRREGVVVDVPVSAFDCLAYLVEHRDRPVGRDELVSAVWGRPDVSETLLGQIISRLRKELGDTTSEQHSIRTLSRKGYRWVAPTVPVEDPAAVAIPMVDPAADARTPGTDSVPTVPGDRPTERAARRVSAAWVLAIAVVVVAAMGLALVRFWFPRPAAVTAATDPSLAMVLPTVVRAPDDWDWLRLGLMDLVAGRLRRGAQNTVASESVVRILEGFGGDQHQSLLDDARLDVTSRLRVQPSATLVSGEWRIHLDVIDHGRALNVDARASDVLVAGRLAADLLLAKLGKTPPAETAAETPPDVADIVQRAKAATLAGKLDAARSIIAQAPVEVRASPEIVWSEALIDASAGHYEAAREGLEAGLSRVSAEHDPALRARMLTLLGAMNMRRANVDAARGAYDEAIVLAGADAELTVLAHAYAGRAVVEATQEDYDGSLADFGRARLAGEKAGNILGNAQIDMNVGSIMHIRGQPAAALTVLQDAARRLQALSVQEEWAVASQAMAAAQSSLLDFPGALETTESFSPPRVEIANERLRWSLALTRARALADNGRSAEGDTLARTVWDSAQAPADSLFRANAAAVLAYLSAQRNDAAGSARWAQLALTGELRRADVLAYLQAWQLCLAGLQQSGQVEQARRQTTAFVDWMRRFPVERASALADFAEAEQIRAEQRGAEALPLYARAFGKVEQGGVPDDMVTVGTRYATLLVERGALEEAVAISARLAPWSERDPRAAAVQIQLQRALQSPGDTRH